MGGNVIRPAAAALAAAAGALLSGCVVVSSETRGPAASSESVDAVCPHGGTLMARYELIFGATWREDEEPITPEQWLGFLDAEVTPRFPDGLTVLEAYGQWKRPDGVIARLPSRMMVIWAPKTAEADASLEAIRAAFNTQFEQLSVMRVDGTEDCVSF